MSGYCSRCGETICICEDIASNEPVDLTKLLEDCNRSYTHLNEIAYRLLAKVEDQATTIKKLLEENARLEKMLEIDETTINTQTKLIHWLEYMIFIAHCFENQEDVAMWENQTVNIFQTVSERMTYSDEPPKYMGDFYEN